MKPSLYVETTIPSFVIGEISPVLTTAARQVVLHADGGKSGDMSTDSTSLRSLRKNFRTATRIAHGNGLRL